MNHISRHPLSTCCWVLAVAALLIASPLAAQTSDPSAQTKRFTSAGIWLDTDSLPAELADAVDCHANGQYARAIDFLEDWIDDNPGHQDIDTAYMILAVAWFDKGHYYHAFEACEDLIDARPGSTYFQQALWRELEVAQKFLAGQKRIVLGIFHTSARTEALAILDAIIAHWPGSHLAGQCLAIQADYYYDAERYIEAQETYQLIVDHYARSDFYEHALLRSAQATHAQYTGPDYDSGPLIDAAIRYRDFAAQYPARAEELGIDGILRDIADQKAHKAFCIADFYARTGRDSAAAYYWKHVAMTWPQSPWAQAAQDRLDGIADTTDQDISLQ